MKHSTRFPRELARVICLMVGLVWPWTLCAEEPEAEEEHSPVQIAHEPNGAIVLTLSSETQERIELKTQAVEAKSLNPSIVAYGKLELDPAASFAIRAPI